MKEEVDWINKAIKEKDVGVLTYFLFDIELTEMQREIVKSIAFPDNKRVVINCMTRYGKSYCVSIGVLLYLLFNESKRIYLIAPLDKQTTIIRNYISGFILQSNIFRDIVDTQLTGLDKLRSEVSKTRITFKNEDELITLSAEGKADRLMGHGGDLVIVDEECKIPHEIYRSKISRMLGDSEDSIYIGIGNPWNRDNQMFEHWMDPTYKKIHVDYKIALKEGRVSKEFIEEQRKLLTPLEFQILYKAEFPEESEDSLFNLRKIEQAENRVFGFADKIKSLLEKLNEPHKHTELEIRKIKDELKKYKKIISCDPADKGIDESVIYWGTQYENKYELEGYYSEPKSESMNLVGKIINIAEREVKEITGEIRIDRIGIGTGPLSRLKEVIKEKNIKNIKVTGPHFGEKAMKDDHFINKKAENYFRLQSLFNDGLISIPKMSKLKSQLMAMRWELNSSGKKKIIDPDKSPDYADCLTFFIWRDKSEFAFSFAQVTR